MTFSSARFFAPLAAAAVAAAVAGCDCGREAREAAPPSIDVAWDAAMAATTNEAAIAAALAAALDPDDYEAAPSQGNPDVAVLRTNLAARITVQLRANAAALADATRRREEAVSAALESDRALSAAYAEMKAARARYEELAAGLDAVREADEEIARIKAVRALLLKQRTRFEGKSAPKPRAKDVPAAGGTPAPQAPVTTPVSSSENGPKE